MSDRLSHIISKIVPTLVELKPEQTDEVAGVDEIVGTRPSWHTLTKTSHTAEADVEEFDMHDVAGALHGLGTVLVVLAIELEGQDATDVDWVGRRLRDISGRAYVLAKSMGKGNGYRERRGSKG